MTRRILVLTMLFLFTAAMSNAAFIDPNLQEAMNGLSTDGTVSAIVYFEHQADIEGLNKQLDENHATLAERNRQVILALQQAASENQPEMASYLETLKAQRLVADYRMYWIANIFVVNATAQGLDQLFVRPELAAFYYNYEVENITPVSSKPYGGIITSHEQGLDRINAPWAWSHGWTGLGRVVMNIDTGVEGTHPALTARFRGDVDGDGDVDESWFDPYNTHYPTPEDDGGHGTHTMGTICGRTASGDTIGVAINAKWIAAGAIDRGGDISRTVSDAIASFEWAIDPDGNPNTQDNPDAIGNSWGVTTSHGYPPCDQTFWTVIDNCEAAGSAVIFSAGNEGPTANSLRRPADRGTTPTNCFSVGAVDGSNSNLPIADFSSRGPSNCGPGGQQVIKPEVVAPGVNVRSSFPGGGYTTMSGTSMASPHVTGSVAILRQVNPNLSVADIKNILMETATDLGTQGEDNTYGHGVINLQAAIQMAMTGFGNVDGYIRNANNNNPLAGRVEIVNGATVVNANSSGYYLLSAPAETTYTLRGSYFGFTPVNHDVTLIANDTVSQDFLLSPAPTAILQGTVTNTNGDSLAGAVITVLDTPLPTDTTDSHGFYQLGSVPTGSRYRVRAQAVGYGDGLDSIFVQSGTNVLNFMLNPTENFENSNGGYSGSGVWEWGTPTSGPNEAHSGTKLWATILAGNYPNSVNDPLYSRTYHITTPNAGLEFWHWYSAEATYDGGNVSISTDNGTTWTLLTPLNGYPDNDVYGLNEPGYSGSSGAWALAHFDLVGYANRDVKFRFRFASDGSLTYPGWYIDDVCVIGTAPPVPPNISYDPSSYNLQVSPGDVATRPLNIHNTGQGYLNFNLSTETAGRMLLDNGKEIPVVLSTPSVTPIGVQNLSSDKELSKEEPLYPPIIASQGGPDAFGHKWIDSDEPGGPAVDWVDISGSGTPVTLTDDDFAGPIDIGFSFPFYQNSYNQLYICSNGMLTFGSGSNTYSNTGIPNSGTPNNFIPIWWDDLRPGNGGTVQYYFDSANSRFIASYDGVPYYSGGGNLYFQAVLYPTGKIELNYATMDHGTRGSTSATIGIEDANGTDGLQIVYNATYMHSNLSIRIGTSWLSASPVTGIVAPGNSTSATITFDASGLAEGTYTGNINLDSDDPDSPNIDIPVTLNVGAGGTADIVQTPSSLNDTLTEGFTAVYYLNVKNMGSGMLTAGFADSVSWVLISNGPFDIAPGDSLMQQLTLDATSIGPGIYNTHVLTTSNDPDTPVLSLPVTLTVGGQGGGCMYWPGDINGNGTPNGIDVVFGVNYFKGLSIPPIDCGMPVGPCSEASPFYAAGDVNGNCSFNGIDITFFVRYLKGQVPALLYCPDCPPAPLLPAVIKPVFKTNINTEN